MDGQLKDIKDRYMKDEYDYSLNSDDIDWLIEQAERYEKLLPKWNNHVDSYNSLMEERNNLVKEIQQLKSDMYAYKSQVDYIKGYIG
jgi:hypothetical protein